MNFQHFNIHKLQMQTQKKQIQDKKNGRNCPVSGAWCAPPSPHFGQLVPLFLDVKNDVLACITERSKDDYDNDVSDNCDHNFGTFDDFGV